MQKIIENFLEITKIPRCSFHTEAMEQFLIEYAREYGYKVTVDGAKNILLSHPNPKICFQAHYDMVCVGSAPNIEPEIKGNIIKAKRSSLGADNGMAIAMMMQLIKEQTKAEFLFTSNEEVGLIGAKNLELPVKSDKLLNLDSEDEAEVYIGCAGGIDLKITKELQTQEVQGEFYELSISNLPGGHSGVDIDKNIPNAIVELTRFIAKNGAKLCLISGGERINSIPANAKATVCAQDLKASNLVSVKKVKRCYRILDDSLLDMLLWTPSGVIAQNSAFSVVQSSANVALIETQNNKVVIEISLRSLDNGDLQKLAATIQKEWERAGFSVEFCDKYPAWKPQVNDFTQTVQSALQKVFGRSKQMVIHAGLECGVLGEKLPDIAMASIGPNISFPHSVREYVEIDSVLKTYRVIQEILKTI